MLVDKAALSDGIAVIFCQNWVLFTEVDQNGIAFCQFELSISDEGDLSEWIFKQVFLRPCLIIADVHSDSLVRDFADVEQGLNCAGGLTGHIPIKNKTHL